MGMKMIDLTYALQNGMSKYPTDPAPKIEIAGGLKKDLYDDEIKYVGFHVVKSGKTMLAISGHHGTHIDAPKHVDEYAHSIDDFPIDESPFPAWLVDLTCTETKNERGYVQRITDDMITKHKDVPIGISALIIRTGYDKIIESGVTNDFAFPYITKKCAEYLSRLKGLKIVGIDSFSVDSKCDHENPRYKEAHTRLLDNGKWILEALVNLDELSRYLQTEISEPMFKLHAIPMRIKGGDAAPARVRAELTDIVPYDDFP